MNADIAELILDLLPEAIFNLNGNTYEGIEWLDSVHEKPTEKQLLDHLPDFLLKKARNNKKLEIYSYFQEYKISQSVYLDVKKNKYSFLFDIELAFRLDSHRINIDYSTLFLWVRSNEGLVRLDIKKVDELSSLFKKLWSKCDILLGQNI